MFNIALKIIVANYNFIFMLKLFVNYNFILFKIVFTDGEGAWGQWSSCLHWDFRIFFYSKVLENLTIIFVFRRGHEMS